MRKMMISLMTLFGFCMQSRADYVDHRNHNVDSLETVMAKWTAEDILNADDQQQRHIADDLEAELIRVALDEVLRVDS